MRGLATTSPTFASVKNSGRCARKHYGISIQKEYIKGVHDEHRRWVSYNNLRPLELTRVFQLLYSIPGQGRDQRYGMVRQKGHHPQSIISTTLM